jgi:hypothetical protein
VEASDRSIQDGETSGAAILSREIARGLLRAARSAVSETLASPGAGRPLAIPVIHLYNDAMVLTEVEMLTARAFAEAPADSMRRKRISLTADAEAR